MTTEVYDVTINQCRIMRILSAADIPRILQEFCSSEAS
jgi:hypothetical protein